MAKLSLFDRRRRRVRTALKSRAGGKPRLSVHRTGRHIYAQIIDDAGGKTVAAASTLGVKVSGANVDAAGKTVAAASTLGEKTSGANLDAAAKVGKDIAAAATKAGVTTVVFDRGGYLFHGRVKALADAAREGGLEF